MGKLKHYLRPRKPLAGAGRREHACLLPLPNGERAEVRGFFCAAVPSRNDKGREQEYLLSPQRVKLVVRTQCAHVGQSIAHCEEGRNCANLPDIGLGEAVCIQRLPVVFTDPR